jgi:serine/threonine-protein kinase TTK/MPS1
LKPANFILVGGKVKLIDFGISKTIQADRTSVTCDQIVGTFNYMSPEAVMDLNSGSDNGVRHIKVYT